MQLLLSKFGVVPGVSSVGLSVSLLFKRVVFCGLLLLSFDGLSSFSLRSWSSSSSEKATSSSTTTISSTRTTTGADAFSFIIPMPAVTRQVARGGGRSPSQPDKIDESPCWEADPTEPNECRLIICQITDVYTLEHLASFKTMVEETRKNSGEGATVVSMLTGDFLSPYLLSSVDRGAGMMNALGKIPLDYLTWGNHEADIDHRTVCRHVQNFPGKWINSNMLDHDAMEHQQEYDVIELTSPDGTQKRKVGLCAVLSDDPKLYEHFKAPGAFGGATIDNPWETLTKYKALLENEKGCDLVVPLQHLYVPDDHKTCREFDFPVILSGHDHHRVDEVVEGTRLLKPGMNAVYSTVVEISWKSDRQVDPTIRARFVKTSDWPADPTLDEENEHAYDALEPLRNTELARVPSSFEPLSSGNARGSVCTMGKYICSLLKSALNVKRRQRKHEVDAVILMGGNIRGNVPEYPEGSYFSLEALEAEIKADEVVAVLPMPGWVLADGIEATHAGEPIPGWMQYDQGIQQDGDGRVTHVNGEPLDRNKYYRVATKISDLTNGQSQPLTDFYKANMNMLPPKGAYVNIQSELMAYFARNLWRKIWDAITDQLEDECSLDEGGCHPEARLGVLDRSGDGEVTLEEIQDALHDLLGFSIDDREQTLAKFVHSFADTTGDGHITLADFENYCDEMEEIYKNDDWRLSYAKKKVVAKMDTEVADVALPVPIVEEDDHAAATATAAEANTEAVEHTAHGMLSSASPVLDADVAGELDEKVAIEVERELFNQVIDAVNPAANKESSDEVVRQT